MEERRRVVTLLLLCFLGLTVLGSAQEYGLEILRTVPIDGTPWLVPGAPKVVMKVYAEDSDSTNQGVTINAIRVGLDPGVASFTSSVQAIKVYAVVGTTKTLIAQASNPSIPVYDPTTPSWNLALTWSTPSANYFIPDDSNVTFEVEVTVDSAGFTEGESLRLVVEFEQLEGPTTGIIKCVVDDQEDIVSTNTLNKGLEVVSDERVGAGALSPGDKDVLVQRILLEDKDDDGNNCIITQIVVDNWSATATGADVDGMTFELVDKATGMVVATYSTGVTGFPVVYVPTSPNSWFIPDDHQYELRIKIDVSSAATNTRTFKFRTTIDHTEGGATFSKWVYDEEEEFVNVPPGIDGLEVIEDKNVGAGLLSPAGDYNTVMAVYLKDHDPPTYNSDCTVYGVYVYNQGTLSASEIDTIEIRHGNQLLGQVAPSQTASWPLYISFQPPVVIPDEGSFEFQVKVRLASWAMDGQTLKPWLQIEHEETGVWFYKHVVDGTEEIVSRNQIDKGLEVMYIVPEPSFGTIAPDQVKKVCTLHLEDADGDADEDDVYITEIRMWNDIRHIGAGVLPLGDREDIFEIQVEGAGLTPMKISVLGTSPLSPPRGFGPIVLNFTNLLGGTGLKIPDDGSIDLVFKVKGNTTVTNGAALRFYFEVQHVEGTYSGFKTDPDGAEEWFTTTGTPQPQPQAQIILGNATLNSTNNWEDSVKVEIANMSMDALEISWPGITFDPAKVVAIGVQGIAGRTKVLSYNISGGHVTVAVVNTTGSPLSSGPIFEIKFQSRGPVSTTEQVGLSLSASDVKVNDKPFTGTVTPGQITVEPGGGGGVFKGDVNRDGQITLADAVLVAEYVMGKTTLDTDQMQRADVDCNGTVSIMDAYYIVQYVINGRPFPCSSSSAAIGPSGFGETMTVTFKAEEGGIAISFSGAELAALKGKLQLLGEDFEGVELSGRDGLQILAYEVDKNGIVELVAVCTNGNGLLFIKPTAGNIRSAALTALEAFDYHGRGLVPEVAYEGLEPPVPKLLEVTNTPNPVRDVHTTYFKVAATVPVEAIRVLVYDLSGRLVHDSGWVENGYAWHLEDLQGNVLANSVYLYLVQVRTNAGIIQSELHKLAILR